ncbi:MAG: 3-methyl-2-oxobutanoate hydroxymethyltransferase [Candidatus Cloacimonetes bacterium]|jgi:3-methyl-2-oxobutanoate hydroxymethyltransferase|nr:3-methyl-2-oxobutanoate hydroxymethyltransferase [Candidatus Cloacimonadota bacterium]
MKNVKTFKKMKKDGQKIVMVTAYDYPSGKYVQSADVDILLVGDSLGMVILGYEDTLKVTLKDIIHHTKAARRGADDTFIVADMPFMSYHLSIEETKENAALLITEGGANAVKLEGGKPSRLEAIRAIVDCEIPVVAHLGLTPQSIHLLGGYKVQGKKEAGSIEILTQAKEIEKAGAFMLVLEGIPEELGRKISVELSIPTIGIGAGRFTDGQVLVYHDILGMADLKPKFVKSYAQLNKDIPDIIKKFTKEVKDGKFPAVENIYNPIK